jgi:formylglycine-generating enzyme required for sulfatase activity/serine/threonine protein kinase
VDKQQAKNALGLEEGQTNHQAVYRKRKAQVLDLLNTALTDDLKATYQNILDEIDQALVILTKPLRHDSELSQGETPDSSYAGHNDAQHGNGHKDEEQPFNIVLAPGQTLASRYDVKEKMGEGCIGVVFRAYDQDRCEDIAIKVLHPSLISDEKTLAHFLTEAKTSIQRTHSNILTVFDVQNDGDYHFLTMALHEGQTLRSLLDGLKAAKQSLTLDETMDIVSALSAALNEVHQHTVHRDIKPENIWITPNNKIKLMDVGVASLLQTCQMTQAAIAMGSAYYMAPEQIRGTKEIDARADQYALAVMIYEMLSGEIPDRKIEPLNSLNKTISQSFSRAIDKALAVQARERFVSISEFHRALSRKNRINHSFSTFTLKILGIATILLVGIVLGATLGGNGGPEELWDSIRPISAEENKQTIEAIQLAVEVNKLKRQLSQVKKDHETKIKKGENDIKRLESALNSVRSEFDKKALKIELEQVKMSYVHNQLLQSLTNRVILDDKDEQKYEGNIQLSQFLIRDKQYLPAIDQLRFIKQNLVKRLTQFTLAEEYLWALERLEVAKQQWKGHNQQQKLLQPQTIEGREVSIVSSERLAGQGELKVATAQIKIHTQAYQQDYQTDAQLVTERRRQRNQQSKTVNIEEQWRAYLQWPIYLKKPGFEITSEQSSAIEKYKQEVQNHVDIQAFSLAEATSKALAIVINGYLDDAKVLVQSNKQKEAVVVEKIREANYQKAMETAKEALNENAYTTAMKFFQKALNYKTNDTEAEKQYQQAKISQQKKIVEISYQEAMSAGSAEINRKSFKAAIEFFKEALRHKVGDKDAVRQFDLAIEGRDTALLSKYSPGISLVDIPSGRFRMGDITSKGDVSEKPVHQVNINSFKLMKHEVTFTQYDLYLESTGLSKPSDVSWGRGDRPVINVNWQQAQAYAKWLSQKTGLKFRLPSEAEWEYAARAGTTTTYPWGNDIGSNNANCDGCGSQWDGAKTSPVNSFTANLFGLQDMHGNVWEWVQDCWNDSYHDSPIISKAWESGDCSRRVLRGGSWNYSPNSLRSATRGWYSSDGSGSSFGFRLAQDL